MVNVYDLILGLGFTGNGVWFFPKKFHLALSVVPNVETIRAKVNVISKSL